MNGRMKLLKLPLRSHIYSLLHVFCFVNSVFNFMCVSF